MATVIKRNKALSVSPLKSSQTIGAALAFLGIERTIPLLHGSQGCTAFGKIFFVRHFREPIPLQTTAVDQTSAVMGSDGNIVEALATLCAKSSPDLIGLPTTGLTEAQGSDVERVVKQFYAAHPEYAHIPVVPVSSPDFVGCLESGFANALSRMIERLVPLAPPTLEVFKRPRLAVLVSAHLTPGDLDEVKDMVGAFGFEPVVLPDLSTSLDGHLGEGEFSPVTTGGTPVSAFAALHGATAVLGIGASIFPSARLLGERIGKPVHLFDHLLGLEAVDNFVHALHKLSGRAVAPRLLRDRARLQDAMLDTHFMLGLSRLAIAADPDLLHGLTDLAVGLGAEVVAAVAPTTAAVLERVKAQTVKIGDLEDLEGLARDHHAQVVIGNSHAVASAERLGLPILRAGFPLYDQVGGFQRTWIGYRGSAQVLFDLANLLLHENHGTVKPYRSRFAPSEESEYGAPASA
ncbi:MAG: nitrogenase iron-molybdenum cofactor biosynthesis protein NifN [Alphaproteobacteria bacterium RIFOXYD12_FULL_60_8]|nr:MAG: nitrogenase iron-molybdenum cofactor biosynthesis protein NifN [Alphaproteobacteria bacterium RIFOXYD12_FULL_60_8]